MELMLSTDQQQIVDLLGRFLQDQDALPLEERQDSWTAACEIGLPSLVLPERFGGLSGTLEDLALAAVQLGRFPRLGLRLEALGFVSHLLTRSPAPCTKVLIDRFGAGDLRPAIALYEEPNRFDLESVSATCVAEGDQLRLDGQKILVVDGPRSNMLFVAIRRNDVAGSSLGVVAVPSDTLGVSQRPYTLLDGTECSDVMLENVRVPADMLVHDGPQAVEILEEAIDRALVALCGASLGGMEQSVALTTAFLNTRQQFKRALSQFQALQHSGADMFVATTDARSSLYAAISALHEGGLAGRKAISASKYKMTCAAKAVTGQSVHLHGGVGFTIEYAIGHHYRRAIVDEKLFGDSEFFLSRFLNGSANAERDHLGDKEAREQRGPLHLR